MFFDEQKRLLVHRFMFGMDWELKSSTFYFQHSRVHIFDKIYFFVILFAIVLAIFR